MAETGDRAKNTNMPKCIHCLERGCYAGEINHVATQGKRMECVFKCGCPQFHAKER